MKQSTGRILTTHAGRLDGPPDLMQTSRDVMAGRAIDAEELQPRLRDGIADVIRKQVEAGIDVKILIPGVVSHASNVVEHPELVADRIVLYAGLVGRENVIAGTDCGMGMRVHPQIAWAKLKALSEGAALATKELWSR